MTIRYGTVVCVCVKGCEKGAQETREVYVEVQLGYEVVSCSSLCVCERWNEARMWQWARRGVDTLIR